MIRKWLAAALIACSCQTVALQETGSQEASSSHYVRDNLFIFMHAGPGRDYRIIGSVNAGTPLTVLDTDNGAKYTQIIDDQDRTGWVESKFVTTQTPQAQQLPRMREQLEQSELSLQTAQQENAQLRTQLNDANQEISRLTTDYEQQLSDIAQLNQQVESTDKAELITWFTRGGIVAGAGIVLGVLISFLPRRRNRSKEWM